MEGFHEKGPERDEYPLHGRGRHGFRVHLQYGFEEAAEKVRGAVSGSLPPDGRRRARRAVLRDGQTQAQHPPDRAVQRRETEGRQRLRQSPRAEREDEMKRLISCEYNMDTNCVELVYTDGTVIAIDTDAVENEYAEDMYQRSELDWLIYNAPGEYAELVLNGDVRKYLREVTEYKPFEN